MSAGPREQAVETTKIERLTLFSPVHHLVKPPRRFARREVEHGARHRRHRDSFDDGAVLGREPREVDDEVTLGPLTGGSGEVNRFWPPPPQLPDPCGGLVTGDRAGAGKDRGHAVALPGE
jgi:hypothetical protein